VIVQWQDIIWRINWMKIRTFWLLKIYLSMYTILHLKKIENKMKKIFISFIKCSWNVLSILDQCSKRLDLKFNKIQMCRYYLLWKVTFFILLKIFSPNCPTDKPLNSSHQTHAIYFIRSRFCYMCNDYCWLVKASCNIIARSSRVICRLSPPCRNSH